MYKKKWEGNEENTTHTSYTTETSHDSDESYRQEENT